jgi:RNA polymerase sigma-70 factor (ECF subfamily)
MPADVGAALETEAVETRAALARALSRLGADEREAVALRYGADLTVPQIAKLTGEKPATIEKRLYRALGKLRKELAPDYALG